MVGALGEREADVFARHMRQQAERNRHVHIRIRGTLQITPFVGSGPAGPTRTATIERDLAGHITPAEAFVTDDFLQLLRRTDPDAPAQSSRTILRVGPGQDRFTTRIRCE